MRTRSASVPSGGVRILTTAALVAVIGALVLGILAMHGVSQHGATPARTPGTSAADPHAAHPAPDHTPVAVASGTATAAGSAVSTSAAAAAADDHPGTASDMVMLCAAMILTAAAGVSLVLRLLRVAFSAPLSLRPLLRVPALAATARAGTGPPAVWEFSVVRC